MLQNSHRSLILINEWYRKCRNSQSIKINTLWGIQSAAVKKPCESNAFCNTFITTFLLLQLPHLVVGCWRLEKKNRCQSCIFFTPFSVLPQLLNFQHHCVLTEWNLFDSTFMNSKSSICRTFFSLPQLGRIQLNCSPGLFLTTINYYQEHFSAYTDGWNWRRIPYLPPLAAE